MQSPGLPSGAGNHSARRGGGVGRHRGSHGQPQEHQGQKIGHLRSARKGDCWEEGAGAAGGHREYELANASGQARPLVQKPVPGFVSFVTSL
jgi:hypothetical protein